jgi:hypothetical protein
VATFVGQSLERIARILQLGNSPIQRLDTASRQLTRTATIRSCVQLKQFPYLLESEASRLRLPNEAQSPDILYAVSPNADVARGRW